MNRKNVTGYGKSIITLLTGVCLSLFGDTTTSCPVCNEPTGVDCNDKII